MNPSTLSEPHPSVPLQTEKQSTESDSSSSVNMDSEHADAIGTPMILVGSDSGKDVPAVAEEKGDVTVDVTVSTEVVENGSTHVDAELTSPLKPLAKRIQAMPEKIISCIIEHAFQLSIVDPVFAPFSRSKLPFWRNLWSHNQQLCANLDSRWNFLLFAAWLRRVQDINETWAAAVENHPFWAIFLSLRPTYVRENEMGSSRNQGPTWLERAQPGRKEAKTHSSLQAEAERTCWVCVFYCGPGNTLSPPVSQALLETTPFDTIPVCKKHYDADMCHCCLSIESDRNLLFLSRQEDEASFGLEDREYSFVCRKCRNQAIEKAYNAFSNKFEFSRVPSAAYHLYLDRGHGTAAAVVENLYAHAWAEEYIQLGEELDEATKRWKQTVVKDCHRQGQTVNPNLADASLPIEQAIKMFDSAIHWSIDRMIDEGMWISPRTLNDALQKAIASGGETSITDALPVIHVYSPPLKAPTRGQRYVEPTIEWPIKERPAPPIVLHKMQREYMGLLPDRVEGTMKNLKTMIAKISNGNMDVAEAKATSMGAEEILTWLNDPRNHLHNWWHNQPFVKPITPSDLARVFSSKSPESENGAKRKREDSDSSGEEKADKIAKKAESKPTPMTSVNAGSEMDVTPAAPGPPSPERQERQASSPPSTGSESQITLAMLTPDKVNRLPWPTPQEVLSPREIEYLRMSGFTEKNIPWDLLYKVPADISELDEITKEILMQVWQDVTKSFTACRCPICRRAREYEKQVTAAEANPQYSEYISLLTSATKAEDMTDHQRSWLANQALLLNSATTLVDEDYDELAASEEDDRDFDRLPELKDYRDLDSDELYDLYDGSDEEMMEEAEIPEDDVSYDIPGARLQSNRR